MLKIIPVDDAEESYRAPDLGWDGAVGDVILNPLSHPEAPGDLRSEQGLATQVLICLMTDRRVEQSELRDGDENRGWFGDSFDMMEGETPLGSRLWLLRRSALYPGIEVKAEDYAREALQPLLDQGAATRVEVTAIAGSNRLDLSVSLYGQNGSHVYNSQFELLWRQIDGVANPLAP
ncbi:MULTISPECIES: phage GP46 family protein [unclassified Rhizobium]|uniref:phage GP46 family protein n=1 Tax=unclassified Rhizobium TaxID=2613769 RepID=UPI00146AF386|nr:MULTISPECIES: phage GP46 family protein [unclassified Rhizobium]MBD9445753.1 phage GP46 family protein [Rhizobium sp. RHZ01]NMN73853.1 phage gp46-like protein [Rhizobium sp. 57MFTsu3.2]